MPSLPWLDWAPIVSRPGDSLRPPSTFVTWGQHRTNRSEPRGGRSSRVGGGLAGAMRGAALVLLVAAAPRRAVGLDDGLATSPPMGWRSWNQFGLFINQSLLEAQFEALADRSRLVDGRPTSLLELGYEHAAIDDGWQECNSAPAASGSTTPPGSPTSTPPASRRWPR